MPCYHPPLTSEEETKRKLDLVTKMLCETCKRLESGNQIGMHPHLIGWWNEHKKHDALVAYLLAKIKHSGMSSLTEEEEEQYRLHVG